jgi:hypothetical protein
MAQPPLCTENADIYNTACIGKPTNYSVTPTVLVAGMGYSRAGPGSALDSRFEIHNVTPTQGSEEGGAIVTLRGVGFGTPAVTSQLMVAVLGTYGDWFKWTNTEVQFTTRTLTLNTDLADMMVNLVTVEHKCGSGQTNGPCKYGAFGVGKTPEVTALTPTSGRAGQTMTITVQMPAGDGAGVTEDQVTVELGTTICPHKGSSGSTSVAGDVVTIMCTIPQFDASVVNVRVRVLPLGYAKFTPISLKSYTHQFIVDSITPNSCSIGGCLVTFSGAGFSTTPARHFVRVGDNSDYGTCEPLSSNYTTFSCLMNWKDFDQDSKSSSTQDIAITLWDIDVWSDPLSVFGKSATGCLRSNDDWRTYNCLSTTECALRCLTRKDCVSFDYRPRYTDCRLSKSSFTKCSSCTDQRWLNCRYFELRSETTASTAVTVTVSSGFTFQDTLTPDIKQVFLTVNDGSTRTDVATTDTGCGPNHELSWLSSSNTNCCTNSKTCSLGEGRCPNSNSCTGNLNCLTYACSWSFSMYSNAQLKDNCCVVRGNDLAFPLSTPAWKAGDQVIVRAQRIGTTDYSGNNLGDTSVASAIASPGNGYITVFIDGLACPVTWIQNIADDTTFHDIACTLPEVPGGLAHHTVLDIQGMGRAMEPEEWLFVPLEIFDSSLKDGSASEGALEPGESRGLGGGWTLFVNGTGFAQAPSANADSYVEVSVCGRRCEVTSSTYTSVECTMPRILTPTLADGFLAPLQIPRAHVISLGASGSGTISPTSFHGTNGNCEVGHPLSAAVFDGDPELTAGFTGTNCQIGLDFGDSNARIEEVRFHPNYNVQQASKYINSKIEVGTLSATQTCDELSFGWRGDAYRGCQDTSERGNKCLRWDEVQGFGGYLQRVPELNAAVSGDGKAGLCRNPTPKNRRGIWCRTKRGNEYCHPKMPDVDWTTIHSIARTPRMLWNQITLSTPKVARFVRFFSAEGNCLLTEMEVRGQFVAPSEVCDVAVRNVRRAPGRGTRINVARPAWKTGLHLNWGFMETASTWAKNPSARVELTPFQTPSITEISPTNGKARGVTMVTLTGSNLRA